MRHLWCAYTEDLMHEIRGHFAFDFGSSIWCITVHTLEIKCMLTQGGFALTQENPFEACTLDHLKFQKLYYPWLFYGFFGNCSSMNWFSCLRVWLCSATLSFSTFQQFFVSLVQKLKDPYVLPSYDSTRLNYLHKARWGAVRGPWASSDRSQLKI